jgi:C4-dicarboxylate-specific signal transduction histidine kinase
LRQAKKLESLGVLAGGIAHDFNNLLTSILGNTDLASEQVPATSSVRENLLGIESATRRAAELCKQIVAYSGKGRLLVRPLDLRSMLEEMSNILAATLGRTSRPDTISRSVFPRSRRTPPRYDRS